MYLYVHLESMHFIRRMQMIFLKTNFNLNSSGTIVCAVLCVGVVRCFYYIVTIPNLPIGHLTLDSGFTYHLP